MLIVAMLISMLTPRLNDVVRLPSGETAVYLGIQENPGEPLQVALVNRERGCFLLPLTTNLTETGQHVSRRKARKLSVLGGCL